MIQIRGEKDNLWEKQWGAVIKKLYKNGHRKDAKVSVGIPSQRYLSKKAETRGRSQKRQEKSYRKWGYFTKEEWAIAQKNPQKASFQISNPT